MSGMTELERARTHLLECQAWLSQVRRSTSGWRPFMTRPAETCVLAALAWVWEEQQRTDGEYVFPRQAGDRELGFELS